MRVREVWGIAGPSGCGKSTLSFAVQRSFGGRVCLLQLDDYFKAQESVPKLRGFTNWDSPEALKFDELKKHILQLKAGEPVRMMTKNKILNPEYERTRKKIPVVIEPREILVVEGYLILHDPEIRAIIDKSVYLNLPSEVRQKRRDKLALPGYEGYNDTVLEPMIAAYVEPSKIFASQVIEVGGMSPEDVMERAMQTFGDKSYGRE